MVTWTQIGRRVESARVDAEVSQTQLAEAVGIHPSAVSRIESGERKIDSLELSAIAEKLGRPVWWFLDERPAANELFMREESATDAARRQAIADLESLTSDLSWLRSLSE